MVNMSEKQNNGPTDENDDLTNTSKRKKHQISISDYFTKRRKMSSTSETKAEIEESVQGKRRELIASAAEKRLGILQNSSQSSLPLLESEAERRLAGASSKEPIGNNVLNTPMETNDEETSEKNGDAEKEIMDPPLTINIPAHFNRTPTCSEYLPTLTPSGDHTILFKPHIMANKVPRPYPEQYRDHWDKEHVRMPCSSENLYPTKDKKVQKRWELIEITLLLPFQTSNDLEEAILVYNHHYKDKWNFESWHSYCNIELNEVQRDELFSSLLPSIVTLALQLPAIVTQSPKLLQHGKDHRLTMTQNQIACLLANAFFCTFPRRNSLKSSEYCNYPDINFSRMFRGIKDVVNSVKTEKIKSVLNYFRKVITDMPTGTVTFHRKLLSVSDLPKWETCNVEFCDLYATSEGNIEDQGDGLLQVDFANRMIGGGVVGEGCVQEEIRFLMCPEMIVSRLFTEKLDSNESLLIIGAERYSLYTGYAQTFKYAGSYNDFTARDRWGRRYIEVIAIDAHVFHCYADQFKHASLKRELEKAFCGFVDNNSSSKASIPAVATGNWGCGAFGGDVYVKSLLQLMAAAVAQRDVVYFTFSDEKLTNELNEMHTFIKKYKINVGQIWNYLIRYGHELKSSKEHVPLYPYLKKLYEIYEAETDDDASSCNEENPLEIRGVPCEIPPDMSPLSPEYAMDTP